MNINFLPKRAINRLNEEYGDLKVIGLESVKPIIWRCVCKCGNECTIRGNLINRRTTCGQCKIGGRKIKDFSGYTFGRLFVIGMNSRKPITWLCLCKCGKTVVVSPDKFNNNANCGCEKGKRKIKVEKIGRIVTKLLNKFEK